MSEVERLLRNALVPVDPPEPLYERVERRLSDLTDAAVDELADWDARALRDPRRWPRYVAAGAVAAGAGGALVLVRVTHNRRDPRGVAALRRGAREVRGEIALRLRRV